MQKLSSWFEQLPLRRRSSNRRCDVQYKPQKQSKSAAPRLQYSKSSAQSCRADTQLNHTEPIRQFGTSNAKMSASWISQETAIWNGKHQNEMSQSFTSYGSNRKNIRTNPWVTWNQHSLKPGRTTNPPNDLLCSSIDRCPTLFAKNLDESACSSGYGSQDSSMTNYSPESSVISPNWQAASVIEKQRYVDKAVDCHSIDVDEALGFDYPEDESGSYTSIESYRRSDDHIYHELESFNRLSMLFDERCYSSDSEFISSTASTSEKSPSPQPSPIYAQPYANRVQETLHSDYVNEYPNIASSFTYIPCASYRPAPKFHAPPPPQTLDNELERAEDDFLAELDAQIAELQIKSVVVRNMVDRARERRDARLRHAQLCLDQIAELRSIKWALHNNFELVL